ncbi:hypothetical protein BKA62DRAFT_759916, partial [Auriculariales sp. MPI-PUGE-AT-0066]
MAFNGSSKSDRAQASSARIAVVYPAAGGVTSARTDLRLFSFIRHPIIITRMDAASERNDAPSLPRNIVLHQGNRRVLVQCPDSYAGGVEMARSVFDLAHDPEDVGLWLDMTSMGQNSTLGPVEISPTAWSVVQLSTRTPLVWVDLKSR